MINIEKELDVAKKASEIAAALLKNYKNDLNEILSDEGRDVKLKADLESEKLIKEYLLSNSKFPILAEESGANQDLGNSFWVVDPLDGTANYSRDIPICCVSIGMIKDMKPLFGVIYDFNSDEIYCGDCINKVATLNNSPIKVSMVDDKKDGVLITGLPFNTDYSDSSLNNLISDMQSWKKTRMIGSAAMASCYIASGKAEVYKEKGIYLWDILAGAAIVEAAGGLAEIKNIRDNYQVDVTFSNQKIKG